MNRNKPKQLLTQIVHKHGGEWLEKIPVMTGNRAGIVDAGNGRIWVRFSTGIESTVLNSLAPLAFDRHILIGRLRSQPAVWRVAEIRENYLESASSQALAHHTQHELGGFDTVWSHRKQLLSATVLVSDSANFLVRVYGGLFPSAAGWTLVESTDGTPAHPDIDLSSYIPSDGAVYAGIEGDDTGALVVHVGNNFGAPDLATGADVPLPPAGSRLIGFVLLYDGQTLLLDEHISVPGLFATDYVVSESSYQFHAADEETTLNEADEFGYWNSVTEQLSKITVENLFAQILTLGTPTTRWVPLSNGDPSDPSLIFDAEGNVIMVLEDI